MSFESQIPEIDYLACRYPGCRIDFRGPAVDPNSPFVAVLGSSEAHGRYVREPFPDLISTALNLPVANLGIQNGGIDAFIRDDALLDLVARAEIVVVQVMGAHNLSNRFYTVHPRRNDRFLRHSKFMRHHFRHIDFSDFVFTRHMLISLREGDAEGFAALVAELSEAWMSRMARLIDTLPGKVMLLWIENSKEGDLGPEPLFVTQDMMRKVKDKADKLVHCDVTSLIGEEQLDDMVFPAEQLESARLALPPNAHEEVASRVVRAMVPMLRGTRLKGGRLFRRSSVA